MGYTVLMDSQTVTTEKGRLIEFGSQASLYEWMDAIGMYQDELNMALGTDIDMLQIEITQTITVIDGGQQV